MHTIISKKPSTTIYTNWVIVNGKSLRDGNGVVIKGGAGVVGAVDFLSGKKPENRSTDVLVGVHTYVDDKALDYLMKNKVFNRDMENGLITVIKGKKLDQDATDNIASTDMIDDAKIEGRPITEAEIEAAGGEVKRDGTVDITEVREGVSPLKVRKEEAGKSFHEKGKNKNKNKKRK